MNNIPNCMTCRWCIWAIPFGEGKNIKYAFCGAQGMKNLDRVYGNKRCNQLYEKVPT